MQIVIDVPEDYYNFIKSNEDRFLGSRIYDCVLNGTVLPKNHGRLIDADAILEDPYGNTYKDIDIAETIIEADKDGERMKNYDVIKAYESPTNGSIFLKAYPDSHLASIAYDDGVCYVYVDLGGSRTRFTSDWWNASYKEACRTERN